MQARKGGVFGLLPLLFIAGCGTGPLQQLNAELFYKRDMQVCMDGSCAEGVLVVPQGARHDFEVTARADMALYTFDSCHREVAIEKMPRTVKGYFTPRGIESRDPCTVEFGGFDAKGGRHSWAFVDFQSAAMALPYLLQCNGEDVQSAGVGICQSRSGMIQRVEFGMPVVAVPQPGCPELAQNGPSAFEFKIPTGQCSYVFEELHGARRARLTTLGYESVLIRQE